MLAGRPPGQFSLYHSLSHAQPSSPANPPSLLYRPRPVPAGDRGRLRGARPDRIPATSLKLGDRAGLLADFLPGIALSAYFGALADRLSRRRLAISAELIRAIAFTALALSGSFAATLGFALRSGPTD